MHCWRGYCARFQDVLGNFVTINNMVDKWDALEDPNMSAQSYRHLILDKNAKMAYLENGLEKFDVHM